MSEVERIERELRIGLERLAGLNWSVRSVVNVTSDMATACDAFTDLCSPGNIRLLLDEIDRLREALKPFGKAAGYLTDENGWSDTDEIELCYDDGLRLSNIPLSAFRAARTLSTKRDEAE